MVILLLTNFRGCLRGGLMAAVVTDSSIGSFALGYAANSADLKGFPILLAGSFTRTAKSIDS